MLAMLLPLVTLLAVPAAADGEQGADILVIARKMRTVRLNYHLFGPHLKSCIAEISSGDPRIDRIMCAVLQKCIADGNREPQPAKICVNRRIEQLEQGGEFAEHMSPALPDPDPDPVTLPPAPPPAVNDADIVVEGRRFDVRPGYWHFSEQEIRSSTRGSVAARPRYWTVCIRPDELSIALEKMLQAHAQASAWGRCSELDYRARDGEVTGKRNCIAQNLRMTRRISGRYDAKNVSLSQEVRLLVLAASRTDGASPPDMEGLVQTTGKYLGDCPDR